ncbi:MAG: hypothetical protein COV72_07955 [Candidatus Omnitrophica bacterium CG11_big_fil_rev_8_21_14_0_20_42_13]|uniref:Uncharacterized protein n=1 Tax=Candidatus Ghiorseimicrobium undicola TaxID=1974746 RepID=A0A2H0LVZ0_9BACT|nr:MAG: hypothetical protein COV72_07955 [Candidatus Omnitrophica bacterium CG11_big_fil_rev_8_21_14_0_20_42_13]
MSKQKQKAKKQYLCQICGRHIDSKAALMHVKAEEYLIRLIKNNHPDWDVNSNACNKCVDYYRKLVKEAEI